MCLLPLAITNLWKVDLGFAFVKFKQKK